MTGWLSRRLRRDEQGAFLVLWALLLLGLLVMVGIVIDLGALRADRRADRATADSAATAGAFDVTVSSEQACRTAWQYAVRNLDENLSAAGDPCTGFPPCVPATSTTTVTRSGSVGGYTITISNPVINGDPLLQAEAVGGHVAQAPNTDTDGNACERVGVQISYTRDSFFAKVAGFDQGTTTVHSVARKVTGFDGLPLSLVVLHPTRCGVLTSSGSGGIEVTGTSSPGLVGGILAVSDATTGCSGATPRVLDVGGNSHITSSLPGHIFVARMTGPTCADPACDPTQYDNAAPFDKGFNPYPEDPILVPDRGLVDGRYNCRANYDNPSGSDPNYRRVHRRGTSDAILPACNSTMVTTPESDFVNHLFREVNGGALEPVSPTIYPNATVPCSDLGSTVTAIAGPARIDCAMPNNFTLEVAGDVWFNNVSTLNPTSLIVNGNTVFGGGLDLSNGRSAVINGNAEFRTGGVSVSGPTSGGGALSVVGNATGTICNPADFVSTPTQCVRRSSLNAAFVFLRPGVASFGLTGGSVDLPAATVFGSGGPDPTNTTDTTGPIFKLGGGGSVTWRAPTEGPFTSLLAWSDKVSDFSPSGSATWHQLSGGGGLTLEGIFFSPLAKVAMTGGSTVTPLKAQFWAASLNQDGGGVFSMTPDGSFILVPVGAGTRLIR